MEVKDYHELVKNPKAKEELEKAAACELSFHVMSCHTAGSRFGKDGFYVKIDDKIYLFKVDISFVREVSTEENIPTGLN